MTYPAELQSPESTTDVESKDDDYSKYPDVRHYQKFGMPKLLGVGKDDLKELKHLEYNMYSYSDYKKALNLFPKKAKDEFFAYVNDAFDENEDLIEKYGKDIERMKKMSIAELLNEFEQFVYDCLSYIISYLIEELQVFEYKFLQQYPRGNSKTSVDENRELKQCAICFCKHN